MMMMNANIDLDQSLKEQPRVVAAAGCKMHFKYLKNDNDDDDDDKDCDGKVHLSESRPERKASVWRAIWMQVSSMRIPPCHPHRNHGRYDTVSG